MNNEILFQASKNYLRLVNSSATMNVREENMNKYQMLLAQAKTYNMLAAATKSNVYLEQARNCLETLKTMLKNDVTKTMRLTDLEK